MDADAGANHRSPERSVAVSLARFLLKRSESFPPAPERQVTNLEEIFHHPMFLDAGEAERERIMLQSSQASYDAEMDYPWDHFFGQDLRPLLAGKAALDLGSFNGGRSVAMAERHDLESLTGLDVDPLYIETATRFAESRDVPVEFKIGTAESLPFEDAMFDAILTYEVFEHVRDPERALAECHRILKPGGRMFVVFPGYYHPTGHHLSLVTGVPFINCLFSGKTLVRAYCEILDERGSDADWYKRGSRDLEPWERSNAINGTTVAAFHKLVRNIDWDIYLRRRSPIGSVGRNASTRTAGPIVSRFFTPFVYLPWLREVFVHRITYILEKR